MGNEMKPSPEFLRLLESDLRGYLKRNDAAILERFDQEAKGSGLSDNPLLSPLPGMRITLFSGDSAWFVKDFMRTVSDEITRRPPPPESAAARDVLAERERQKSGEGWTEAHDDAHSRGEMAAAAATYAINTFIRGLSVSMYWPWDMKWFKPKGTRRDLVRAGALILAEIERLDRAAGKVVPAAEGG